MNNRSAFPIASKIGTVAGAPLILLAFMIVYGEAQSILVTLLVLTPIVVFWTRFVALWLQAREQDAAPEAPAEPQPPRDA